MSLEEFKAKYRWAEDEAMLRGNVAALDEVYAPDVVIHTQQYPFKDLTGVEARKQQVLGNRQAFQLVRVDWYEMIGEGTTVAFRYAMHMKHIAQSPTVPIPPTGKEFVLNGCQFLKLKDGKVNEVFGYADMLGVLQQLGAIPDGAPKK